MYHEQELRDLIELARKEGADILVINDAAIEANEGRQIIQSVRVRAGIAGIGPTPMSGFFACERLREAKANGFLGPVIRRVVISPLPRDFPVGMGDPLPFVTASFSDGHTKGLFGYHPDEIRFTEDEFLGKTLEEAMQMRARKDREYLLSRSSGNAGRVIRAPSSELREAIGQSRQASAPSSEFPADDLTTLAPSREPVVDPLSAAISLDSIQPQNWAEAEKKSKDSTGLAKDMALIMDNLASQDNLGTEHPLFVVKQVGRVYGVQPGYTDKYIWINGEGEQVDEETSALLDRDDINAPDGHTKVGYLETEEFVTACFTRAGAQRYLDENAHNMDRPFIYAESSHRNTEMRAIRTFLADVAVRELVQDSPEPKAKSSVVLLRQRG